MGKDPEDDKEVTILGRIVRWMDWGIEYEADNKHRKVLMEKFGMEQGAKVLTMNGEFEEAKDEDWELEAVDRLEAKDFRASAARSSFLGQDSPEMQYPAKEVSKDMAEPKRGSWKRLKIVIRFVAGREKVVWTYPWQDEGADLDVYADSDWGGRAGSRKSTSGGAVLLGAHCLKTWSST